MGHLGVLLAYAAVGLVFGSLLLARIAVVVIRTHKQPRPTPRTQDGQASLAIFLGSGTTPTQLVISRADPGSVQAGTRPR